MQINKALLEELCNMPGIAGREDRVIRKMKKGFESADAIRDVKVDKLGNVIASTSSKETTDELPSIVIFAHMDEVGFMVKKIEKTGFLRVEKVGSANRKTLPGESVAVEGRNGNIIKGIIGVKSYHFQDPENRYDVPHVEGLYIDIGADDREGAREMGVRIGSMVTYSPNFDVIGEPTKIKSKALDNRIGCYQLLDLANELKSGQLNSQIYLVASVQEEFNLQGVVPAMEVDPDVGISLDVYPACDTPDLGDKLDISLGNGPVLTLLDFHGRGTIAGLVANPALVDFLGQTAEKYDINTQRAVSGGILTDASYAQFRGDGVIMGTVSIPTRYTHSPQELVDLEDVISMGGLLRNTVQEFDSEILKRLGRG